jgi:hypothetical protein
MAVLNGHWRALLLLDGQIFMINPWVILGFVVALATTNLGSYFYGMGVGEDKQAVADQGQFDKINADLTEQKRQASAALNLANEQIRDELVNRDKFKNQLGEEREKNRQITHKLSNAYAAYGLQFELDETPRCWRGGVYTKGAACYAASDAQTAVKTIIQLPEKITADLRQFADDSEGWLDEYRLCYAYTHPGEKLDDLPNQ